MQKNRIIKLLLAMILILLASCAPLKHNLTIEVSFDHLLADQEIEEASLSCQVIPKFDYKNEIIGNISPSSPNSWCGIKANNLPLAIRDTKVLLDFHITPSPQTIEFDSEPSPAYDSPMLYLKINGESYLIGTENTENNFWKTRITLR
ncbi:MAG: hypothetical protein Q8P68_02810 [Candidatus Peregrinibacteria bacterium]|nr:hypothetical protein [Candidatus Peregrinibacteria bacterium]